MGKSSKRKSREKRKNKQCHQQSEASANTSSAVHQLRHPDPKTRHGALIALQASFFSSTKQIHLTVLQAIREQVLDKNLDCAMAAAECLAQYLSSSLNDEAHRFASDLASWTGIFVNRLKDCHEGIVPFNNETSKTWYALAAPCLRALCHLIETNEAALAQLNECETFLQTSFLLIHDAMEFKLISETASLTNKNSNAKKKDGQRVMEWVKETADYATRVIHSALDDNMPMVQTVNTQYSDPERWGQAIAGLSHDLPKIHLCGCIVNAYQTSPQEWHLSSLSQHVLPSLTRVLQQVQKGDLSQLENDYSQACQLYHTQKADDALEQEVVKTVAARKEPARLIARRLKQTPKPKADDNVVTDQKDGQQAMEAALIAWNDRIMPWQVALEVTANLLSSLIEYGDDQMEVDGGGSAIAFKTQVQGILHTAQLVPRLLESFLEVATHLTERQQNQQDKHDATLTDDLMDTLSKMAGCLVNAVLSGVLPEGDYASLWSTLRPHVKLPGVCGVLVVVTQHSSTPPNDLIVIHELLAVNDDDSLHRDGVALLTATFLSHHHQPVESVIKATQALLRLLHDHGSSTSLRLEILTAIMDVFGQDDFHPDVFVQLNVLSSFQACITSTPKQLQHLDPEQEEILLNAERFVDYKLGR